MRVNPERLTREVAAIVVFFTIMLFGYARACVIAWFVENKATGPTGLYHMATLAVAVALITFLGLKW